MAELTPDQLAELGTLLEARRRDLLRLLDSSDAGVRPVSLDEPIGRLSRMDALQQQQMAQANQTALKTRLDQVNAALRRVEGGSYGFCLACEEPISHQRLAVRPETPLCIDCQRSRETS